MLSELRIREYAIIEKLSLELKPGLIVFTGETGAGKSIIIDAVELILGGRAETVAIRTGAKRALIEGTFRIPETIRSEVHAILEREGLLDDPDYVTLGREIRREGRNISRVNGRMVTLSLLREIGQWLVDVHGQSEHLSLHRVAEHIRLLDRFAQAEPLLERYQQAYQKLQEVRSKIRSLKQAERDSARRADLLSFQVNEIEASALKPGEEKELQEERTRLANAEQLSELVQQAIMALDEGLDYRTSASDLLGQAVSALNRLANLDESLNSQKEVAQGLLESVGDLNRQLRDYFDRIAYDPKRLDVVEERLALIQNLRRKYGEDIQAILSYAERARSELEDITDAEEKIDQLTQRESELLNRVGDLGLELSAMRKDVAERLAALIDTELAELNMSGAEFGVAQEWQEDGKGVPVGERKLAFTQTGLDEVEFLVSPNPGEGLKPLAKIASGGETTRLMLALKTVLAKADLVPTLIFDEIDQGIGGRVGGIVGQKLWDLARGHQVLCITHLPQLAAFGDQHFRVEKQVADGRTTTVVHPLDRERRISELAQMLGGETDPNRESALALLRKASEASIVGKG
jgi:DNA repair protein RecN (Recombination protein N)